MEGKSPRRAPIADSTSVDSQISLGVCPLAETSPRRGKVANFTVFSPQKLFVFFAF